MEIWKDIESHKGSYQVSNLGRIKSLPRKVKMTRYGKIFYKTIEGCILRSKNEHGYYTVGLRNPYSISKIHRLVCAAFHPNPDNKPFVNHKDLNKLNNHEENLEWVTGKENSRHARDHGHAGAADSGEKNGRAKLTEEQVLEIRAKYIPGSTKWNKGYSQSMLAREYGVTKTLIRYIIHRKLWSNI